MPYPPAGRCASPRSARGLRDDPLDDGEQLIERERLLEQRVGRARVELLRVHARQVARQEDEGERGKALAHGPQEREPRAPPHRQIADHEIDGRTPGAEPHEGLVHGLRHQDVRAEMTKQMPTGFPDGGFVIDQQDAKSRERRVSALRRGTGRRGVLLRRLPDERYANPEARAAADHALDRDGAARARDRRLRDGQPEAAPALLVAGREVGVEDPRLIGLRNPGPVVGRS